MQNPSPTLLQQISNLSSYPISSYSPKIKVEITFPADEDRTKQSFKAESDVNNIMARYQRTGVLDFANKNEPRYADVTGLDFQAGMQVVATARSMFADLPSSLRARFNNDPGAFLDFVNEPRNYEEARELGLLKPKPDLSQATVATVEAIREAFKVPKPAAEQENRTEGAVEAREGLEASEPRAAKRKPKTN